MKILSSPLTKTAVVLLNIASAAAQGSFQNLDFEATTVAQTDPRGPVPVTNAFPGWTVYYGTNQQTSVLYNDAGFGSTLVDLLGTNGLTSQDLHSIEGGFSALLQGGVSGGPNLYPAAASIRQVGVVPVSARTILFKTQMDTFGIFSVSLNGSNIPYFPISSGPAYTLFGGDVSAFAGATAELDLSLSRLPGTGYSNWNIDSIQFSDITVPEPGTAALLLLASAICGIGWCRYRSRDNADKSHPRPPPAGS